MNPLLPFLTVLFKPKKRPKARRRSVLVAPLDQGQLQIIWDSLARSYFPDCNQLVNFRISWSRRAQKRVLGSCNIRQLKVSIARELSSPNYTRWLEAVVYHEMCHAVLGDRVARLGGRRSWHGKEFVELEQRHPDSLSLKEWMKSGGWSLAVLEYQRSLNSSSRTSKIKKIAK